MQGGNPVVVGSVGQAALTVLLVFIAVNLVVHMAAVATGRARLRRLTRLGMTVQFLLATLISALFLHLLITENNAYVYVAEYTGPGLALLYRIAAFWGGNAGSLLFWVFILTTYGVVVAWSRHDDSDRMLPIVTFVLSLVTGFFALVLVASANPFARLAHPAAVGSGLSPLLQNPGMTVHPVNVYLGYIGFTVPFAYAMAGLWLKKTDATWLTVTRRWTLVSWLFLSIGIVYGAHWSYEELGWGGYWAWDPVENASLLPWLTGTAFLHSAIVQEKRGMLKAWNVILVTLTFLLTLLGTFLTRSGVLWSIHAFANGPLGTYFLVFLCLMTVASVLLMALRWRTLKADRRFEAVVSKESSFMLNNVLFLGVTFAVLWGTVFPIISEAVTGQRIMVSAPFYNQVALPIAVCILLLMGIGPVVAWKRSSTKNVAATVVYPLGVAVVLGIGAARALHVLYGQSYWLSVATLIAALYVVLTVIAEFYRSVQARVALTGDGMLVSMGRLIARARRRYGGYIVHIAVAVMAIGIAGSGAYHVDVQQSLTPGQTSVSVVGYRFTFAGMGVSSGTGSRELYANLIVHHGNSTVGVLRPSATFYTNGQAPATNVALYSRVLRDVYVVLLGTSNGNTAVFDIHVNPLVEFIWFGGYLFIFGTLVSLWPERVSRRVRSESLDTWSTHVDRLYEDLADLEYDYRAGKVDDIVYHQSRTDLVTRIEAVEQSQADTLGRLRAEIDDELSRQSLAVDGGVRS